MISSDRPQSPSDLGALARVLDALLPGNAAGWPSCSTALDAPAIAALFDQATAARLASFAMQPEQALAAFEQQQSAEFGALLRAVYQAYYSSGAVQSVVRARAEAAPREASPHLDPTLVARVLATGAGKRRL